MGPALCNIFINDLPPEPGVESLECYVDDSQLHLSFPVHDTTLAADQLTEDLRNITETTPAISAKNLGVTMACNLTFDERVTRVASKCIGSLCQINRFKHDKHTLVTLINSLVFSELLYCSSVWANTTKKNIELVQAVQNFAARIVSGTWKFDHVTPILNSCSGCQLLNNLRLRMLPWYSNA